jgi:hypothetical protein
MMAAWTLELIASAPRVGPTVDCWLAAVAGAALSPHPES